jgi:hypothetical protein
MLMDALRLLNSAKQQAKCIAISHGADVRLTCQRIQRVDVADGQRFGPSRVALLLLVEGDDIPSDTIHVPKTNFVDLSDESAKKIKALAGQLTIVENRIAKSCELLPEGPDRPRTPMFVKGITEHSHNLTKQGIEPNLLPHVGNQFAHQDFNSRELRLQRMRGRLCGCELVRQPEGAASKCPFRKVILERAGRIVQAMRRGIASPIRSDARNVDLPSELVVVRVSKKTGISGSGAARRHNG